MRQTHYSDNQYHYTQKWNKGVCMQSASDYSPFGVLLEGRTMEGEGYRYGFNSMEHDPDVKGQGKSYTTLFRQYDPRLGCWLSLDQLMAKYPGMSPYVAFNNNPIFFVDPLGLEGTNSGGPGDPEKTYTQNCREVIIEKKGLPKWKVKFNRFMMKHSLGKYKGEEYDATRHMMFGNKAEYDKARSQVSTDASVSTPDQITTTDFVNLYKKYGWSRFDPNVVTNDHYDQAKLEKSWGKPIEDIVYLGGTAIALGTTGGLGAAFITTGGGAATYSTLSPYSVQGLRYSTNFLKQPFVAATGRLGQTTKFISYYQIANATSDVFYQTMNISINGGSYNYGQTFGALYFKNPFVASIPGTLFNSGDNIGMTYLQNTSFGLVAKYNPLFRYTSGYGIMFNGAILPLYGNILNNNVINK